MELKFKIFNNYLGANQFINLVILEIFQLKVFNREYFILSLNAINYYEILNYFNLQNYYFLRRNQTGIMKNFSMSLKITKDFLLLLSQIIIKFLELLFQKQKLILFTTLIKMK